MRQIDFEHGGIAQNILKAALPMLVAQVLNLLYNIVDRIYIARIPDIGTAALGAVGLCFPIIVIITAFSAWRKRHAQRHGLPHRLRGRSPSGMGRWRS